MKTVILGLGNPILYDDGAGFEAASRLKNMISRSDVEVKTASVGGLRILDQITGFERAIIIDALMTGSPAGTVKKMTVEDLSGELHASCVHDLSFGDTLRLGKTIGMAIPERIVIYGIEVSDPFTLHEGCSREVLKGVEEVVMRIKKELDDLNLPEVLSAVDSV